MNKENKLDLPDENEAIKEALKIRGINKFSIPFDNTFLNTIKNKKQEEQTYLIGKYAFIEFLKKNSLNYSINEDSIFVLKDSGLKIKISTKIWNTEKETKYSKLPYLNLFSHDKTKDYDYKIQLLALSKNGTYKNIEKIFVVGFLSKEDIIKIYKNFKPTLKCKYPCFTINELSPISEFVDLKVKITKESYNIDIEEIKSITENIQKEIKVIEDSIDTQNPEIVSKFIRQDDIEQAKEFSRNFSEKICKNKNKSKWDIYLNTLQGKISEMAVYNFLHSENLVDERDWDRMLKILNCNYDFGDFILPNKKIIDVKSQGCFNWDNPYFYLSEHNLEKNIDYFVFSVIDNFDKYNLKKNKYKVDLYGFISKYKIKSLINEKKIDKGWYKSGNYFYIIPWKYLRPMNEIYQP